MSQGSVLLLSGNLTRTSTNTGVCLIQDAGSALTTIEALVFSAREADTEKKSKLLMIISYLLQKLLYIY